MIEEWKGVNEFEGYEVSNLGRVRSWRARNGKGAAPSSPRMRTPHPHHKSGHLEVSFVGAEGKHHLRFVHRLVLEAFVGPAPDGLECCHKDGNPRNNELSNLRWDTRISNFADRRRHKKEKEQS